MQGKRLAAAFLALTALGAVSGCDTGYLPSLAAPSAEDCAKTGTQRMLVAELFFGRTPGYGGYIGDTEWYSFLEQQVTPLFPDGLTVYDAYGQSKSPRTALISRETTKVLMIAAPNTDVTAQNLERLIAAFKARFQEESVFVVERVACAGGK